MRSRLRGALIAIWIGTMLGLSIQVGAYSAKTTNSPLEFVASIALWAGVNILATILLTLLAEKVRPQKVAATSANRIILYTMSWLVVTTAQLIVVTRLSM